MNRVDRVQLSLGLAALMGVAATACSNGPALTGAAALEEADRRWLAVCASCHGPEGLGDGPVGRSLSAPPRTFTDAEWQASVSDAQLREVIVEGGASVGLSAHMPPSLDLRRHPEVLDALVTRIRSLRPR